MSLLMDALKKAEQEKKEAAKRLKEAQEKSGLDLTLEESSPVVADGSEEAPEIHDEDDVTAADETREKPTGELSLAPLQAETEVDDSTEQIDLSKEDTEPPPETVLSPDNKTETTEDELKILELENEEPVSDDDEAGPEERKFALDALSVDEDYISPLDESGRNEIIEEPLLESTILSRTHDYNRTSQSSLTAEELAKTLGDDPHGPMPVAAQTVFNAAATLRNRRQFIEWSLFIFGFAVFIIAGSAFYYLNTTPKKAPPTMPITADSETVIQESIGELTSSESGTFVTSESPQHEGADPVPLPDNTSVAISESIRNAEKLKPVQPEIPVQQYGQKKPAILPEDIEVEPAAIQISRSRSASQKDVLLHSAYRDYQAGNYDAARNHYKEVLNNMPQNKDALLGLAAIAHKRGDLQEAYQYYLQVIKFYPSDVIARTALINLADDKSSAESETLLKLMIRDSPETAALYFTLGNVYAANSRWAEAQQSFFDALRLEKKNADYAYNLAVSLEHLGKTEAALQYYEQAMELADNSPAALNVSTLASRISVLSALSRDK